METKKLKNRGNNLSFRGEGNLRFKDSKIQRFKDSKFKIQLTSYFIPHTSFSIQDSSNCSKSNCNILWLRDDDL